MLLALATIADKPPKDVAGPPEFEQRPDCLETRQSSNFTFTKCPVHWPKKIILEFAMTDSHHPIAKAFDLVDRVIWVVTAAAGARSGLVATWVMQSSLDRAMPKVSLSLNSRHFTTQLIEQSGAFGLHLLRADQTDLAWRFGLSSGRDTDKFAGLKMTLGVTGSPILTDCLAALECRVLRKTEIGDRICSWSEIVAGNSSSSGEPLSEHALLATATVDQQILLRSQMQRDVERERLAWQSIRFDSPNTPGA